MIKKRDAFRPFAPAIVEERCGEFFSVPDTSASLSYMSYVLDVREEMRTLLGAVTHINGSARVQTVTRAANPFFWDLLNEFGSLTGVPILLNTSFNNNAEPIVESIDDAVTCFLTTALDYLVVGDCLVCRKRAGGLSDGIGMLSPRLPPSIRLEVQCAEGLDNSLCGLYKIYSAKDGLWHRTRPISSFMFDCLMRADGCVSLLELAERATFGASSCLVSLIAEAMELWEERLISLTPFPR